MFLSYYFCFVFILINNLTEIIKSECVTYREEKGKHRETTFCSPDPADPPRSLPNFGEQLQTRPTGHRIVTPPITFFKWNHMYQRQHQLYHP